MANFWKLGAMAWCVAVLGWFVSPIISLLVSKLSAYLVFDPSRKLRVLEIDTIPILKQTLADVEEKMMRAAAEGNVSRSDLDALDKIKKDLKYALYEAEDILDIVDYYRIKKNLVGDGSGWVQHLRSAACACISRFKGSWFWRRVYATRAALLKTVQLCRSGVILLLSGATYVSGVQRLRSCCWHVVLYMINLFQLAAGSADTTPRSPVDMLMEEKTEEDDKEETGEVAVEIEEESEKEEKMDDSSAFHTVDTTLRPPVDVETEEETEEDDGDEMEEETEEDDEEEEGEVVVEIEEEKSEEEEMMDEGEEFVLLKLTGEKAARSYIKKQGWLRWAKIICHCFWHCARSIITSAIGAARRCRDRICRMFGVKIGQKDDTAANSFLPVIEGRRLKKTIEHIENIVSDSKKSHLLNEDSGSSSSKILVKDTNNKESGSTQEEIDDLHRGIKWEVFGREKEREHICNMRRKGSDAHGSKPYCVIGIHGITGSGKSTLAQYVCDHEKKAEDKHFDLIMFSHVSTTFSVDKIFLDMLKQITKNLPSDDTRGPKSLQKKLKEKLQGKRFLLVLDDLWVSNENQKGQDILLDALDAGRNGSVILVTAQREDAAAALGAHKQILLPDLEEKDFLSLFMHHALPGTINDGGEYERIGRNIANKLHRSPIVAVTVGKQLQRNRSKSFWKATANSDVLNETMGALWWSYQQLDVDIRRCFAYCSTFPRGYKLERDQLVHIWIAQGFVNTRSDGTEEFEDVGERYFDELLTFSFLQVQRTTFDTEKFTIHDLLHKLAERVAGSDFYRIDSNDSPKDILQGVRHVFIETNNAADMAENYLDLGNLRTLIIKERRTDTDGMQTMEVMERNHDLEKVFERLFMRMTKLRVLIVELNHKTEQFSVPASIGQMKHLRYFGFYYDEYLSRHLILPSTFSKLYHMQTIDVLPYCNITCPEDMSNLIHLRHISGSLIFPNVGRLTSLQTLPCFNIRKERGYELKQLKHLNKLRGTLEISGLGIVGSKEEALQAHLTGKKQLRKLALSFKHCRTRGLFTVVYCDEKYVYFPCHSLSVADFMREKNLLPLLPQRSSTAEQAEVAEVFEGLCPPKDLLELVILDYNTSRYPSWMLSRQHPDAPMHLQTLHLSLCNRLASIPEDSVLFEGLLELHISYCDWDSLPENMERLVSLQTLFIEICDNMELLPTLPQSLQKIKIHLCRVLSTTCDEDGHENWHKIQHIPEKCIISLGKNEATIARTRDSSALTNAVVNLVVMESQESSRAKTTERHR